MISFNPLSAHSFGPIYDPCASDPFVSRATFDPFAGHVTFAQFVVHGYLGPLTTDGMFGPLARHGKQHTIITNKDILPPFINMSF